MKIIKEFLSNNKEEIKVLSYGVGMLAFGLYFGGKIVGSGMDKELITLGDTGQILKKIVGNEIYTLSVVKEQINKD